MASPPAASPTGPQLSTMPLKGNDEKLWSLVAGLVRTEDMTALYKGKKKPEPVWDAIATNFRDGDTARHCRARWKDLWDRKQLQIQRAAAGVVERRTKEEVSMARGDSAVRREEARQQKVSCHFRQA